MTAEQALIEENKKDPRVRYITNDKDGKTCFWSTKPNPSQLAWNTGESHVITTINNYDFSEKDWSKCILCIDDIKLEVPPIPEKWYIECTEENRDILNEWRLRNSTSENYIGTFQRGHCLLSDSGVIKDGTLFCSKLHIESNKRAFSNYQKITLEQFKKHILKEESEEKKEPEKQEIKSSYNPFDKSFTDSIANHPLMSIAESEREESQKEQEEKNNIFSNIFLTHQMARYFSEIGIPVYSILKNSLGLEDERVFKMVSNNEIYLKYLFVQLSIFIDKLNKENNALNKNAIESKVKEINESIENHCESWACIPTDWIEERNQLIETLNNL